MKGEVATGMLLFEVPHEEIRLVVRVVFYYPEEPQKEITDEVFRYAVKASATGDLVVTPLKPLRHHAPHI